MKIVLENQKNDKLGILQKEVDRIAKKYEDKNEELEVFGEHPKVPLYGIKRDSNMLSEEEVVNILKEL